MSPAQWSRMAFGPVENVQHNGMLALVDESTFLPILVFYATILIINGS